jgi:hypothetical protein
MIVRAKSDDDAEQVKSAEVFEKAAPGKCGLLAFPHPSKSTQQEI